MNLCALCGLSTPINSMSMFEETEVKAKEFKDLLLSREKSSIEEGRGVMGTCMPAGASKICRSKRNMDPEEILIDTLKNISVSVNGILQQAKQDAQDNPVQFATSKIKGMFALVDVYKQNFEELKVKTKKEFEEKSSNYFSHTKVQEAFDELLDSENEWDRFLTTVDMKLWSQTEYLKESDPGPFEYLAVDARSGEKRRLCSYMADFDYHKTKILVVSFGDEKGAKNWLQETKCPFDMVLDSRREIYHTFGLGRSVSKTWNISCMAFYAEQKLAGRKLPTPYKDVNDDPNQMGGDFILDNEGVVRLCHRSKQANDRPTAENLVDFLQVTKIAQAQMFHFSLPKPTKLGFILNIKLLVFLAFMKEADSIGES